MLNNHQKTFIRKYASTNKINKYTIGKNLLDKSVLEMLNKALLRHEVIKISFLKSAFINVSKEEIVLDILGSLHAELVSSIGNTIVIYKPNMKLTHSLCKEVNKL